MKWSCEWLEGRSDPDIRHFLQNMNLRDPLSPRYDFFGGMTIASKLHHQVTGEEKILRYDIVSLYPRLNENDVYLNGHPAIILGNFGNIVSYFGLILLRLFLAEQRAAELRCVL